MAGDAANRRLAPGERHDVEARRAGRQHKLGILRPEQSAVFGRRDELAVGGECRCGDRLRHEIDKFGGLGRGHCALAPA